MIARMPSAGFISRSAALTTAPTGPASERSVSAMKGRSSAVSPKPWSRRVKVFQPMAPMRWPGFSPALARMSGSGSDLSRGCAGELKVLA